MTVHPVMKILSSWTHLHVVPNLNFFLWRASRRYSNIFLLCSTEEKKSYIQFWNDMTFLSELSLLKYHFTYRFVLLLWFSLDVYFVNCFFIFSPHEGATDSVSMLNLKYTEDSVGLFSFLFIFLMSALLCVVWRSGKFWIISKAIINAHIFGLRIWTSILS